MISFIREKKEHSAHESLCRKTTTFFHHNFGKGTSLFIASFILEKYFTISCLFYLEKYYLSLALFDGTLDSNTKITHHLISTITFSRLINIAIPSRSRDSVSESHRAALPLAPIGS
jgi:hypothetical protein